jgi:TPR repeat protein
MLEADVGPHFDEWELGRTVFVLDAVPVSAQLRPSQCHSISKTSLWRLFAEVAENPRPKIPAFLQNMETELPSINLSDAEREILLSYAYCLGAEVVENADEVVGFFRKYADAGHAFAQTTLGNMYLAGHWVEKDEAQAIRWLRKSAEQGDPEAQYQIGNLYRTGEGLEKNEAEAAKWLTKPSDQAEIEE